MRDDRVRIAPDHLAKVRLRLVEFGLLQVSEPDVDARHIVGGIGLEDGAELGDAFLGAAGIDEHEAKIIAGVQICGIEVHGALIGFDRTRRVARILTCQPELIPRLRVFGLERGGCLQLHQRFRKMRGRVQRVAQMEAVVEVPGIERHRRLKLRNAAAGILIEPVSDPEMVARERRSRDPG